MQPHSHVTEQLHQRIARHAVEPSGDPGRRAALLRDTPPREHRDGVGVQVAALRDGIADDSLRRIPVPPAALPVARLIKERAIAEQTAHRCVVALAVAPGAPEPRTEPHAAGPAMPQQPAVGRPGGPRGRGTASQPPETGRNALASAFTTTPAMASTGRTLAPHATAYKLEERESPSRDPGALERRHPCRPDGSLRRPAGPARCRGDTNCKGCRTRLSANNEHRRHRASAVPAANRAARMRRSTDPMGAGISARVARREAHDAANRMPRWTRTGPPDDRHRCRPTPDPGSHPGRLLRGPAIPKPARENARHTEST